MAAVTGTLEPNDLASLEAAFVARVKEALPNLEVIPFPDKPETYHFVHDLGAVLVRYHGATFGPQLPVDAIVQEQTANWYLMIYSRNLRDHQGAYDILTTLQRVLTGFKAPGCDKAYPVSVDFVNQQDGVWVFDAVYQHTTLAVEKVMVEVGGPLLGDFPYRAAP
jgi:hypothetical protein